MIKKPASSSKKTSAQIMRRFILNSLAAIMFSVIIFSFIRIYNNNFKPILKEIALYRAEQIAVTSVSNGVIEVLSKNKTGYDDIVKVSKTKEGKLTSLSINLFKVNELKSRFTLAVNRIINNRKKLKICIPLGNLTGIELFSGMGPMIPVEVLPEGTTLVDFENNFSDAGVNQTRHTVSLKITTKITMIMPNNLSVTAENVQSVPIAESIIIGDVPDNFTILETEPGSLKDDILNLN